MENKYVPEGDTDLKSQSAKEEALQGAISTEHKKKVRKTLRDQLRASAIKKHKASQPVKKNKNKEEVRYIKELDKRRHEEAERVWQQTADHEYEYDKKRAQLGAVRDKEKEETEMPKVSSARLKLKVKKNKQLVRKKVTKDDLT